MIERLARQVRAENGDGDPVRRNDGRGRRRGRKCLAGRAQLVGGCPMERGGERREARVGAPGADQGRAGRKVVAAETGRNGDGREIERVDEGRVDAERGIETNRIGEKIVDAVDGGGRRHDEKIEAAEEATGLSAEARQLAGRLERGAGAERGARPSRSIESAATARPAARPAGARRRSGARPRRRRRRRAHRPRGRG